MKKPQSNLEGKYTLSNSLQKEMIGFFQRVFTPESTKDEISQQPPPNKKAEVDKND